jgi:hypothetical protein
MSTARTARSNGFTPPAPAAWAALLTSGYLPGFALCTHFTDMAEPPLALRRTLGDTLPLGARGRIVERTQADATVWDGFPEVSLLSAAPGVPDGSPTGWGPGGPPMPTSATPY